MRLAHYQSLENMYLSSPINDFFPATIDVSEGEATLVLKVETQHHNAAHMSHGCVYFKLLDDSAVFAASSFADEFMVVTAGFTTNIKKPVTSGVVTAIGKVTKVEGKKLYAESIMYDEDNNEVATGKGLFLPCNMRYTELAAYKP